MMVEINKIWKQIRNGAACFWKLLDGRWGRGLSLLFLAVFIMGGVLFFIYVIPRIDPDFFPREEKTRETVQVIAEEADPARNFSAGIKSSEKMDYPQALAFFRRAVEKDPDNVDYLNELALTEYKLKDYDDAIADYLRLSEMDGENVASYRNRIANIHWIRKDYAVAEAFFRQAINDDPRQSVSYNNLALMLEEQGRGEEALSVLADGIGKSDDGSELRATLMLLKDE